SLTILQSAPFQTHTLCAYADQIVVGSFGFVVDRLVSVCAERVGVEGCGLHCSSWVAGIVDSSRGPSAIPVAPTIAVLFSFRLFSLSGYSVPRERKKREIERFKPLTREDAQYLFMRTGVSKKETVRIVS